MPPRNKLTDPQPVLNPLTGQELGIQPTWADAYQTTAPIVQQSLQGAWQAAQDPQTWRDAANAYGQALVAGSVAPGEGAAASPAFQKWFGASKVVDTAGKPVVVYHGTAADFDTFNPKMVGTNYGVDKKGFFFHSDPEVAGWAAGDAAEKGGAPSTMPVYLSLKNPLDMTVPDRASWMDSSAFLDTNKDILLQRAKAQGSDGLIIRGQKDNDITYVALKPNQIKSSVGNQGTFSKKDPRITYGVAGLAAGGAAASAAGGDE